MSNVFTSKRGIHGLIILLAGILVLCILGTFLLNYYIMINRRNISIEEANRTVISWAVVATNGMPQLRHTINRDNRSWLFANIAPQPLPQATVVKSTDTQTLQTLLDTQKDQIYLSIELPNLAYLNIRGQKPDLFWKNAAGAFCLVVLILLLVLLCYWIIQYISTPLDPLIKAVQRFSYDIKAPNIQEQGPPEMQLVIRAFNAMQDNLRSLLEGRTQMLAAISHDLRTPITRLKLRTENIDEEKTRLKFLADLDDMEQMIASILAFARQQNANEAEQSFDLNVLLESICNDQEDMGKQVIYTTTLNRLTYFGRMLSLKRAFTNIIENAVKYGQCCTVNLSADENSIIILFQDQGSGIPEDKLEKVFEPFYRVNTARSPTTPGSGLGLAVAKEIITTHGGEIKLHNTASGLQVKVTLPCKLGNHGSI